MPSVDPEICIPLLQRPAYTKRKLRVVTIGAGYSGLTLAHKIQHEHADLQEFIDHTIFEALDDIGGTWAVNTYPGVQCDVPAHIYAFPFDPNPKWDKFYADGPVILEYMKEVCDKWNLRRDIRFGTRVVGAEWQDEEGRWKIAVEKNGKQRDEYADILISAQGFLSAWKWPAIPGIHDFKGHKVHSANWDHNFDYANKKIGIIGNGSSGIQILPQMAKLEGTDVTSFQREPTWITPSLGSTLGIGNKDGDPDSEQDEKVDMESAKKEKKAVENNFNPSYSEADIARFSDKSEHREYRRMLQHGMNRGFRLFIKGSEHNRKMTETATALMREKLNNDPDLCSKLIPTWTFACRRLTPGEGYLESFLLPNVHLTQSPIKRITSNTIETETDTHEIDVLVCATGFDVSNVPRFPVVGKQGVSIAEKWADEPESYLSLACPDMPNYFIFTGPNATVGHGSLLTSLQWSAEWMIKWMRKMASEGIKSVTSKQSATDEFVRYGDQIQQTLTWTGSCRSWYKNHRRDGRVTATWPGSALLYRQMISELRPEDFVIEYRSRNRFSEIMGNGFTAYELVEGNDLAFFVK
ncbi:hypothetical protein B0A49_01776 [Cryomyces minteri]|uniref:Sterigmatocystin biosynthesis monooxygenase stcW n=1 Tax=Cryomyces minteri TaxID=331657 RepID=A0A4U0XQ88_9PEZI|nr:hypothetical protein B0A49_01776 [Cryomyces minteri]